MTLMGRGIFVLEKNILFYQEFSCKKEIWRDFQFSKITDSSDFKLECFKIILQFNLFCSVCSRRVPKVQIASKYERLKETLHSMRLVPDTNNFTFAYQ